MAKSLNDLTIMSDFFVWRDNAAREVLQAAA